MEASLAVIEGNVNQGSAFGLPHSVIVCVQKPKSLLQYPALIMDSLKVSGNGLRAGAPGLFHSCQPESHEGIFKMPDKSAVLEHDKKIALVAHDNKKHDLVEWAKFNKALLSHHKIYATGTTGQMLEEELGIEITRLQSGPLGGDQQIGAKIADGEINFLIFFWDPLEPMPHDPDVKALLRIAVVWNIPIACNRSSADFMISSQLMDMEYSRILPDYDLYRNRDIGKGDL
jgi:methylglyoxal synthase